MSERLGMGSDKFVGVTEGYWGRELRLRTE